MPRPHTLRPIARGRKTPRPLPIFASVALEIRYRRRLEAEIDKLARSLEYWIATAYRANPPEVAKLAADASPSRSLAAIIARLRGRWLRRFDDVAAGLGRWFAAAALRHTDAALRTSLKRAGFAVDFRMTRAMNDALQAVVQQNVSLIRSIPRQYFEQVEGAVQRSVVAGRDLARLNEELRDRFDVARRRAVSIAQHQSNMAAAMLGRVRHLEIGIKTAVWLHSHAGRFPRPSHLANHGKEYDIEQGWFDPAIKRRIWPGTEPNCRCVSRTVVPGFG